MSQRQMFNRDEASSLIDAAARTSAVIILQVVAVAIVLIVAAFFVGRATAAERPNPTTGVSYSLLKSGQTLQTNIPSLDECYRRRDARRETDAPTKTSGSARFVCRADHWMTVSYQASTPVTCPAPPPPRQQSCSVGTGTWTQTATVSSAPACVVTWTPSTMPPGACPEPDRAATLNWTHSGVDVSHFEVQYGLNQTFTERRVAAASTRQLRLSELPPGNYSFRVVAFNATVASPASNVLTKVIAP